MGFTITFQKNKMSPEFTLFSFPLSPNLMLEKIKTEKFVKGLFIGSLLTISVCKLGQNKDIFLQTFMSVASKLDYIANLIFNKLLITSNSGFSFIAKYPTTFSVLGITTLCLSIITIIYKLYSTKHVKIQSLNHLTVHDFNRSSKIQDPKKPPSEHSSLPVKDDLGDNSADDISDGQESSNYSWKPI